MKKLILFLTLSSVLFLFSSCRVRERMNISHETKTECSQLLHCLSENDAEGLKAMFCKTIAQEEDFDDKVSGALDFFDGSVTAYDVKSTGANERIADGIQAEVHISPHIGDITTDSGKTYSIRFYSCLINSENPEKVGISELSIECGGSDALVLGSYEAVN